MQEVVFSRKSDEWETPSAMFEKLNEEFHFTLDPCATSENRKCSKYYTLTEDGLKQNWGGQIVFCNPPYSKIGTWVKKAYEESIKPGTIVVLLIPARTDTRWFHDYIQHRSEIRFIKGRLRFRFSGSDANAPAPFPSMVVIFRAAKA